MNGALPNVKSPTSPSWVMSSWRAAATASFMSAGTSASCTVSLGKGRERDGERDRTATIGPRTHRCR